ncbi:MAG: TlyA family RNA methyltransferase [Lachnospiraceae bacterium]|nr:TlyA family RNA methyltransferase [Lachnospiraceae bacterium]
MKERLDIMMVQRGLVPSREKAKAVIMAGEVLVEGKREDKAGTAFSENVTIAIKRNPISYVSRGGLKLEKAVKQFSLKLDERVCMDVGSSTGGFTDCMLQNGASKVYSVDVGYGQLDWMLRNDERVICMERSNIRYVTQKNIPDRPSFVAIDVSFISLTKVLPAVKALIAQNGELICLIKPQFEAGREKVGKKGVVRNPAVHREVISRVSIYAQENGFKLLHLAFSPIKGSKGNIEYLLYLKKSSAIVEASEVNVFGGWTEQIRCVVEKAHVLLD